MAKSVGHDLGARVRARVKARRLATIQANQSTANVSLRERAKRESAPCISPPQKTKDTNPHAPKTAFKS